MYPPTKWRRAVNSCGLSPEGFVKRATCASAISCISHPVLVLTTMEGRKEQFMYIKCCMKLGKTFIDTFTMIRGAFEEQPLSRTQIFDWYARFKASRVSVEDDEHSGQLSTSNTAPNVEKIPQVIHEDRQQTIQELTNIVGISYEVCQGILTEFATGSFITTMRLLMRPSKPWGF